jgi:hypothetical protein
VQELFSRLYQATNENEALNEALQNAQLGLDIANKMKRDLRMDIVSQHRELGRCAEEINGLKVLLARTPRHTLVKHRLTLNLDRAKSLMSRS